MLDVGWEEPRGDHPLAMDHRYSCWYFLSPSFSFETIALFVIWVRSCVFSVAVLVTNVARTRMRDMENLAKQEEQQAAAAAAASGSVYIVESTVEGD